MNKIVIVSLIIISLSITILLPFILPNNKTHVIKELKSKNDIIKQLNTKSIHNIKRHNILLLSNGDFKRYANSFYMDFVQIEKQDHILSMLYKLFYFKNYNYVIYVNENYLKNATKDIKQFIYKSGNSDLILFQDIRSKFIMNECIIYKPTKFSKYNIFNVIENNSKITFDVGINQLHINKTHDYINELPLLLQDICVYNRELLSELNTYKFHYPYTNISHGLFTEIPTTDRLPIKNTNIKNIPKYIFQHMETNITTQSHNQHVIRRITQQNPEYEYFFLNGYQAYNFIKEHFDNDVLYCYDKLIPGAYKCDLFRYCLLYIYGGVYIDFNVYMLEKLNSIIEEDDEFISALDFKENNSLWQGFLCVKPNHPVIKKSIDMCCHNIKNDIYYYNKPSDTGDSGNRNVMNITGPELIGDAINKVYNINKQLDIGTNILNGDKIKVFKFFGNVPYIMSNESKKIACNKYFNDEIVKTLYSNISKDIEIFYNVLCGKEKYGDAYDNKRVFKKIEKK